MYHYHGDIIEILIKKLSYLTFCMNLHLLNSLQMSVNYWLLKEKVVMESGRRIIF